VREAVWVYANAGQYKDAIVLAKARLLPEDPLLPELYLHWAQTLEQQSYFEHAAKW